MTSTKIIKTKQQTNLYKPWWICIGIYFVMLAFIHPLTIQFPVYLIIVAVLLAIYESAKPPTVTLIPPQANAGNIEIAEIKHCIIDEHRLIIYQSNHRMYEFYWVDFSSYFIDNKILYLIKVNTAETVIVDENKIGVKYFQEIFLEVMEKV